VLSNLLLDKEDDFSPEQFAAVKTLTSSCKDTAVMMYVASWLDTAVGKGGHWDDILSDGAKLTRFQRLWQLLGPESVGVPWPEDE
jgi:hypothetical protein